MSKNNDLSFEEVDALLAYEPDTGVFTRKVSRQGGGKAGSVVGCPGGKGHLQVMVHGKKYLAHRLAWLLSTGAWPSQNLDHINGDPADNRIENLRECSNAENQQNRGIDKRNKSGVTGVVWHKQANKWKAEICINRAVIYLGLFDSIEEAASARAEAKVQYHTFNPVDR